METVDLDAWVQMGPIRRETTIRIPKEEFRRVKEKAEDDGASLEERLEDHVLDWMHVQYGWGGVGLRVRERVQLHGGR